MQCAACQHEGNDFHKLIFMTNRTKEESGIMIKESCVDVNYNFCYRLVDLNACPDCGTVKMERIVK